MQTEFYHGTSLEAIMAIQESGFRVDLSGSNAGAALGPGVYVTTTLLKALNYAEGAAGKQTQHREVCWCWRSPLGAATACVRAARRSAQAGQLMATTQPGPQRVSLASVRRTA